MAPPDRPVGRQLVPAAARLALRLLAPRGYADSLLEDLRDEAREVAATSGRRAARRWLGWQILHSIPPLLRERLASWRAAAREVKTMTTQGWLSDGKYAVRRLRRSPGFAAVAVLTLALGIGATSAIFSLAYAVWLKPLPFQAPDRLVTLLDRHVKSGSLDALSAPEVPDMREGTRSFSGLAAYAYAAQVVRIGGERVRLQTDPVTPNLFAVLGVGPDLGRLLTAADIGRPVFVLSHAAWVTRFGGDPAHPHAHARRGGHALFDRLGVMPASFRFPEILESDAWMASDFSHRWDRAQRDVSVVARLASGVTLDDARRDVATEAARLAQAYPATNAGWTATVTPLDDRDQYGATFGALLGIVGLFLAVGCANLAGLLIARNVDRRGELTVCASLGATRARLARQLVMETTLLGAAGGGLGLALAAAAIRALAAAMPPGLQGIEDAGLSATVIGFSAAVSGAAVVLCGVLPAVNLRSFSASEALTGPRRAGPGSQKLHGALVIAQVAVAMVLIVGATLMARSFAKLLDRDRGFDPHGVLALDVSLGFDENKYEDAALRARTLDEIVARAASLPGVLHAGATNGFPGSALGILGRALLHPDGGSSQKDVVGAIRSATPDYFAAMGVALRAGRVFQPTDTAAAQHVAIVNETLARAMWPQGTAIGRVLAIPKMFEESVTENWTVVGVVADMHLGERAPADIFLPVVQRPAFWVDLVMRTSGDPSALKPVVRRALLALNPDLLIENATAIDAIVARSVSLQRAQSVLIAVIAILSTLVAGVGLYSMLAFAVARRTRELGIRLALGSAPRALFLQVFAGGMRLAGAGVVLGGLLAALLVRILHAQVFGLASTSPWAFVAAGGVLAAIAALALWAPARRALRTDPLVAMRSE